jgi:hypothetical protein
VVVLVRNGEGAEGRRVWEEGVVKEFKEDFGGVEGMTGDKGEGVGVGDGEIEGVVSKEEVVDGCVTVVGRGGDVEDVGGIIIIVGRGRKQKMNRHGKEEVAKLRDVHVLKKTFDLVVVVEEEEI